MQEQGDWKQLRKEEDQRHAEAASSLKPFERNTFKERAAGVFLKLMGNADEPAPPVRNPVPLEIVHMGASVALTNADEVMCQPACIHATPGFIYS
jgi:hypothetical protein